jgi:hypothetical protein
MTIVQFIAGYFIFRLLIELIKPLLSPSIGAKPQARVSKKITYLVNGREINAPHWQYYQQLIGLYGQTDIDNTKIKDGAKQTKEELIANYPYLTFDVERDIRAARSYLLDNWGHMVMLN